MSSNQSTLVWLDLEMTGLNPDKDGIVEIALVTTDNDLNIVAQGPNLVIHQPDDLLDTMDAWVAKQHTLTGLTEQVRASQVTLAMAEQQVLIFLQSQVPRNKSPLCGNSIYVDRSFLRHYMPSVDQYLHYRVIDVSSIKEIITRWYPNDKNVFFEKKKVHRALDDVFESIAELKHYRTYFFKSI